MWVSVVGGAGQGGAEGVPNGGSNPDAFPLNITPQLLESIVR